MPYQDWLVKMLQHAATHPGERIMALFDILHDWMDAPGLRQALRPYMLAQAPAEPLLDYLEQQARLAGCSDPDGCARQIYYLALGALHEALSRPNCSAVSDARKAAEILLAAHSKPTNQLAYAALAAALLCLLALPASVLLQPALDASPSPPQLVVARAEPLPLATQDVRVEPASYSPDRLSSMHQTLEKLQQGVCQYPQALMLPAEQRSILIENIVNGELSANHQRMQLAQKVALKVDCYYAPIAMTSL
jgi:hypothetical protein